MPVLKMSSLKNTPQRLQHRLSKIEVVISIEMPCGEELGWMDGSTEPVTLTQESTIFCIFFQLAFPKSWFLIAGYCDRDHSSGIPMFSDIFCHA